MRAFCLVLLGALCVAPASLHGQRQPTDPIRPLGTSRFAFGGALNYGRPVGDFYHYVEQGWGFDGFFRWNLEPQGIVSLRVEGGYLSYGRETKRVPLSSTIGGRILVDLTTSNNIVWLGLGPQLTLPVPFLRPYINASGGFSYFFTESSVEGSNNNEAFANTTNYDDGTWAWGVGGGFLIPFATRSGEVAIDLGARYHGNGEVRYLREGSIIDVPDGNTIIIPIRSEANLVTFRIGVSVSVR